MWYWLLAVLQFVLGYSALITVFCGIAVWEMFTKTPLSADTKWGLYAGAFIGISFWNWHKGTVRVKETCETAAPAPRVFAEDPELFFAYLRDPRHLLISQFCACIDQWITVSGRVEGAVHSLTGNAIHLSLISQRGQRVNLRFSDALREKVKALQNGQFVTAVCQIQGSAAGLVLENCELIHVETLRQPLARVS